MPPRQPVGPRSEGTFNWYQTAFAETTIQLFRYLRALKFMEQKALEPIPVPVETE